MEYALPEFDEPVHSITLDLDGTCMLMHKDAGGNLGRC